jgi:GNAT superfamily N-acetyltransferase
VSDDVVFSIVDAGSAQARWAMEQYFEELALRFTGGFEPGRAFDEATVSFNPPKGLFVVASREGDTVGCGAIQYLDNDTAEFKRMWVSTRSRGVGLGKRLLARLEQEARRAGCARVVLDTNESLSEAIAMYRTAGYLAIERCNDNPYAHHWFEKSL